MLGLEVDVRRFLDRGGTEAHVGIEFGVLQALPGDIIHLLECVHDVLVVIEDSSDFG